MKHILLPVCLLLVCATAFSQTSAISDTTQDDKIFIKAEVDAAFPGGGAEWTKFMTNVIKTNIDDLVADNKSGTCRLRFIVDKEGNVSDIEALTMKRSVLARIVIDAIANGPKWTPARQNERVVKAYKEQPVTFTLKPN